MFLIIGVWGGPKRVYSAFKFFLFTLLGSVLMLVAIIVIYWLTGTTDITQIYEIKIPKEYQNILWLAFLVHLQLKCQCGQCILGYPMLMLKHQQLDL